MYKVHQYLQETGRVRWAVLDIENRVWYFPASYGKKAAKSLEFRMMKKAGLV